MAWVRQWVGDQQQVVHAWCRLTCSVRVHVVVWAAMCACVVVRTCVRYLGFYVDVCILV